MDKFAKTDPFPLWKTWKDNNESTEHFQPLLNHFKQDLRNQVNKFSANQYVSKAALEKNVFDNFLKACQTYKPGESALRTHVINYGKKTNRFVGESSNVSFIPEPRRQIITKYNNAKDFLSDYLEREPDTHEILKHMNESLEAEGKKHVTVNDIETLKTELSKRDIYESSALDEAEIAEGSKEHQVIMSLYHSTPIANGTKHQFRLTNDEHAIFKEMFPLNEDGSLNISGSLKPKQIAQKLDFSQPKISRSIKMINKKIKNTIGILS